MARFYAGILCLILFQAQLNSAATSELQAPKTPIPASYFGLHIHHLSYPTPSTSWPDVPVPAWRLWDAAVTWPFLEPAKGQWQFDRLDGYLSLAEKHGTTVLLTLGMSPGWANGGSKPTAPPQDIDDWRAYVTTVASRYKGRIPAYEVWNEPNLTDFWTGTTDQLIALTKAAAEIIHSVDPKAIVVSPAPTGD